MTHPVLLEMIADADSKALPGSNWGGSVLVTPIGEIRLYRDYKVAGKRIGDRHARSNWRLDGKVISVVRLQAKLTVIAAQ